MDKKNSSKKEKLKNHAAKLKEKSKELEKEVRGKTVGYILGGLGVVAGLAWNDTIKAIIGRFFPGERTGIFAHLAYASLMTILVVIAGIYLSRLIQKENKK